MALHGPGQLSVLHISISSLSPTHCAPPFLGEGLLHCRVLFLIPPPHVTLHSLHSLNSLQLPSTATLSLHIMSKVTGVDLSLPSTVVYIHTASLGDVVASLRAHAKYRYVCTCSTAPMN